MDPHSFYLLDPDPNSEKLLDPDPQKKNADPQPCHAGFKKIVIVLLLNPSIFR